MQTINNNKIQGIYAICDPSFSVIKDPFEICLELLKSGIKLIQLRMKSESDLSKIEKIAAVIMQLKKDFEFTFIVNDYLEIAMAVRADGLHLGQNDMAIKLAKQKLGSDFIVGYSSHSVEEALQAIEDGADYVALGAIFPTSTKGPGHPVCGISELIKLCEGSSVPVVAIGGINLNNILEVKASGTDAIAMISQLIAHEDISKQVSQINAKLNA